MTEHHITPIIPTDLDPDAHFEIFTDGSCLGNPGPGGYSAIIRLNNQTVANPQGAHPDTTNNRMELAAVIAGLQAIPPCAHAQVLTDSKYIANAFNLGWLDKWQKFHWVNYKRQPVKNRDLWQELLALTQNRRIVVQWIKGHHGNTFNELADQQARANAQNARADRTGNRHTEPEVAGTTRPLVGQDWGSV